MKNSTRNILRELSALASPSLRYEFGKLCLLNICMAVLEMVVAGSISLLGIAMASPDSLSAVPYIQQLQYAIPFPGEVPEVLSALIIVMALVAIVTVAKNLFLAYLTWQQNSFAQSIAWEAGTRLFEKYLHAPQIWHIQQNSAELLTYIGWKNIVSRYIVNMLNVFTQIVVAFFLICSALYVSAAMSIFLFCTIFLFAIATYKTAKSKAYEYGILLRQYDLQNSRVSMQGIHGIKEVLISDEQESFINAYKCYIKQYIKTASKQAMFNPLPVWVLESVGMLLLLAIVLFLVFGGASVAKTSGTLTFLAGISWRLLPAANKSLGSLLDLKGLQPIVEQFLIKIKELPESTMFGKRAVIAFDDCIDVNNVQFYYPQSNTPALRDVTLRIPRKKMIGLIGLSGSGKSTLTGIITGLLQPSSGELFVDGVHWDSAKTRLTLGYVPQHLYLLDASLADNIAFCIQGDTVDEARVRQCCAMAAMDFIEDLSDGIHTMLGERGVRLSGGQIQRVGIARALYSQPSLLIFDEATSALDGATEQAIQHTIEGLRDSMTVLVIAHRLTTVTHCDYIYWLDEGKIRMEGTPENILPAYSNFLDTHAREVMEEVFRD